MLRSSTLTCAMAATLVLCGVANADVYKYTDAKGNVEYTDKPHALPAERLNVQSQKTDAAASQARADAERKQQDAASKEQQAAAGSKAEQQQANATSAKDKAERCTKARARYDGYMNSQRLYEDKANGERRYLDESEIDAARASAKASMEEFCK